MPFPKFPAAIVSRDGRDAVVLKEIVGIEKRMAAIGVAVYLELAPREEPVYAAVYLPDWITNEYNAEHLRLGSGFEEIVQQAAVYGLGAALDTGRLTPPEFGPQGSLVLRPDFTTVEERALRKGREQNPPNDEECFTFLGAKAYNSWKFGYSETALEVSDELRLGCRFGDLDRIALAGENVYWTRVENLGSRTPMLIATPRLILELPAGRFPGLEQSPIQAVSEKLKSPRYEAVAEAWRKAVEYTATAEMDLPNGAKEAVAAVESLAKIVSESPKDTLGQAIKTLRNEGKIREPLDRVFHKLWGFSSEAGGVRHGGVELPDVTLEEATFILNMAAAAMLYLLEMDRPKR